MDIISSYEALDTSKHEVRLVYLQPGVYPETVECELIRANLDQHPRPEYEALSYEWGSSVFSFPIRLGDRWVFVKENLYSALQCLRCKEVVRVLWIDALCINQENVVERNHQVIWMGEIYKRAARVIIWLGLRDPLDRRSYEVGILFDIMAMVTLRRLSVPRKSRLSTLVREEDISFVAATISFPGGLTRALRAVYDLFNMTYWKRLWI